MWPYPFERREWETVHRKGTWLARINDWLVSMGWSLRQPYQWSCALGSVSLLTSDTGEVRKESHLLREQWRRGIFGSFLSEKRRDSVCLAEQGVGYSENRCS